MLLDTQAVFVRATTLGFRADATGALSGNWALNTGITTPGDIHVFADGGINVCRVPVGGSGSPAAAYSPRQFTDSRYYRLRATLRVQLDKQSTIGASSANTAPLAGHTLVHLLGGDIFGSGSSAFMVRSATANLSFFHNFTVTMNQWYRVILERINERLILYASTTSGTTPDNVPQDSALTVLFDQMLSGFTSPPLWPEIAVTGAAIDGTHYTGSSDLILEEFNPLPDKLVSPAGGGFEMPRAPYQKYKTLRAATDTLNNLVLGP